MSENRRVLQVLETLCDRSRPLSEATLLEVCEGDADMARRVRELLRHHEVSWAALDGQGVEPSERWFGPYRVRRELGRGGQAAVYLAEDSRLGRQVAVKVLGGASWLLSEEARGRFEREAAVAARLDHPNLCPIYEVGSHEGVPYMVMRYVEGETLDVRLAREREQAADSSPGPSGSRGRDELASKVAFVERLARALEVAHGEGILHRDIKPGNIMVAEDDEPVLLDFGLARPVQAEVAAITQTGQLIGTPAYMAPEQVRGSADLQPAADVFALGATLYEMVTLRRPFQGASLQQLLGAIEHDDPPRPRKLEPAVGTDLEVVLLTALEKDPARRYATALAFAEDLRAVLEHRPILARPPGRVGEWLRFVRRHRGFFTALSVVLLALVAGIVATGVGIVRARTAERKARVEQARTQEALRDAAAVAEFFDTLVRGANAVTNTGKELSFREALDLGAERLEESVGRQPRALAELHRIIGEDYGILDQQERALHHLRRSIALWTDIEGPTGRRTQRARFEVGRLLVRYQRGHEALELFLKLDEEYAAVIDEREPVFVARTIFYLGDALRLTGDYEGAEREVRRAIAYYRRHGELDEVLAELQAGLAAILRRRGQLQEGEVLLREAVATMERVFGDSSAQVASLQNNLAVNLRNQGRHSEALGYLERALATSEAIYGEGALNLLAMRSNRARILGALRRHEEAIKAYRASVAEHRRHLGPHDWRCAFPLGGLSAVCRAVGLQEEALANGREAVLLFAGHSSPNPALLADARVSLALSLLEAERPEEALAEVELAEGPRLAIFGGASTQVHELWLVRARALRMLGRVEDAEEVLARLGERSLGPVDACRMRLERALLLRVVGDDAGALMAIEAVREDPILGRLPALAARAHLARLELRRTLAAPDEVIVPSSPRPGWREVLGEKHHLVARWRSLTGEKP